jgi:uncharacterized protein (TIGR03435 family)
MHRNFALPAVIMLVRLSAGNAQPPLVFDVASVKWNKAAAAGERSASQENIESQPGSLTMRNVSLTACIKWAFEIGERQISGPGWLAVEKYDIAAKSATAASISQLRLMLRSLLAERFKLQAHRETKDIAVYALVVASSGPKLHIAEPGGNTNMRAENGGFVFRSTSMPQFADDLSSLIFMDRPVLDRTGLPGVFDFVLKFGESNAELKRATLQGDGPSIFTIIQEQTGVKLEPQKGPVEMLVIDHVEKVPVGN